MPSLSFPPSSCASQLPSTCFAPILFDQQRYFYNLFLLTIKIFLLIFNSELLPFMFESDVMFPLDFESLHPLMMFYKSLFDTLPQSDQLCISILLLRPCPACFRLIALFGLVKRLGTGFLKLLKVVQLLLPALQVFEESLISGICVPALMRGEHGVKVDQCLRSDQLHLVLFLLRAHPPAVEPLLQLLEVPVGDHLDLQLLFEPRLLVGVRLADALGVPSVLELALLFLLSQFLETHGLHLLQLNLVGFFTLVDTHQLRIHDVLLLHCTLFLKLFSLKLLYFRPRLKLFINLNLFLLFFLEQFLPPPLYLVIVYLYAFFALEIALQPLFFPLHLSQQCLRRLYVREGRCVRGWHD